MTEYLILQDIEILPIFFRIDQYFAFIVNSIDISASHKFIVYKIAEVCLEPFQKCGKVCPNLKSKFNDFYVKVKPSTLKIKCPNIEQSRYILV